MNNEKTSHHRRLLGRGCIYFSMLLWFFITLCTFIDWDWMVPITIFPFWCWSIVGGIAVFVALRLRCKRSLCVITICLWVASAIWFSDNIGSLWRLLSNPEKLSGTSLRIVTLNCAGNLAAAKEVMNLNPDVVLLQEIPRSTNGLAEFAGEIFGDNAGMIAGFDCAILVRGRLEGVEGQHLPQFVRGVFHLSPTKSILITSLRLVPPAARLDLWNPKAWRDSVANHRLRRQQLMSVVERSTNSFSAEILGGDFNTTANDTTLKLLSKFEDAHCVAGRGWGNTVLNNIPIARPDRIWVKNLQVISAQAIKTINSDHRMVLAVVEISDG